VKVKGIGLKHTVVALERIHGKAGLEIVKAAMPARFHETIATLKPLEWYPVEIAAHLHLAIRETLGGGLWTESQRISMVAAKLDITGPYRMMMRAVQYDTVWDRMERIWPQYYDAGEAKWVDRGRGHATAEFRGVAGFNEGMWGAIAGRIEMLLEMTGARGAAITLKDMSSTRATLEALWLE
jgi:hypothetical protein